MIIMNTIQNLGKGFEAEITSKQYYSVTYTEDKNGEVTASAELEKTVQIKLVENPFYGVISTEELKKAGLSTTEFEYKVTTTYYQDGEKVATESKLLEAIPREGNTNTTE